MIRETSHCLLKNFYIKGKLTFFGHICENSCITSWRLFSLKTSCTARGRKSRGIFGLGSIYFENVSDVSIPPF